MTKQEFELIARQIVIDYPYTKHGRLNTFFANNDDPTEKKNFGVSYQDFLKNKFWSRSWVNGGSIQDNIHVDFGALLLESINRVYKLDGSQKLKKGVNFKLFFIGQINCDFCTETEEEITEHAYTNFEYFFNEFSKYNKYEYLKNGVVSYRWSVPERAQIGDKKVDSSVSYIVGANNILAESFTDGKSYAGVFVNLQLKSCEQNTLQFQYNNEAPIIQCDIC